MLVLNVLLQAPQIKYRLPSDPTVWVDLVDDDDVAVSQQRVLSQQHVHSSYGCGWTWRMRMTWR